MIVYAEVLQGYTPIIGARVTATIESNSGKTEELVLLDNGAGNSQNFMNEPVCLYFQMCHVFLGHWVQQDGRLKS